MNIEKTYLKPPAPEKLSYASWQIDTKAFHRGETEYFTNLDFFLGSCSEDPRISLLRNELLIQASLANQTIRYFCMEIIQHYQHALFDPSNMVS